MMTRIHRARGWLPIARVVVFMACITLVSLPLSGESRCLADPPAEDKWVARLATSVNELLLRDDLTSHDRQYVVARACSAFAVTGYAPQAIALTQQHLDADGRNIAISLIASCQSQRDDVAGALQTAELLTEGFHKQRTLQLIAVRQAQRGDFDDAVNLLPRISDAKTRDRGLELIIHEYLDAGAFPEADELAVRIRDEEIRDRLRKYKKRIQETPSPGDPDYEERTVQQTRADWEFAGFSDDDEQWLRLKCRAKVALHEDDPKAFRQAMDDARQWIKDRGDPVNSCSALLGLGMIYHESGDGASASEVFRKALGSFLNQQSGGVAIDFVRISLASGEYSTAIVQRMPAEEIISLTGKMIPTDDHNDLLGGLVIGAAECGEIELAERIYGMLRTPDQQFHVSAAVCEGLAKRGKAE